MRAKVEQHAHPRSSTTERSEIRRVLESNPVTALKGTMFSHEFMSSSPCRHKGISQNVIGIRSMKRFSRAEMVPPRPRGKPGEALPPKQRGDDWEDRKLDRGATVSTSQMESYSGKIAGPRTRARSSEGTERLFDHRVELVTIFQSFPRLTLSRQSCIRIIFPGGGIPRSGGAIQQDDVTLELVDRALIAFKEFNKASRTRQQVRLAAAQTPIELYVKH